jgi:hypothetical protein
MAEQSLPDELAALGIEEVRVARLEPGDVVVLMAPERLNMEQADTLRERAAELFAGHRIAVLEGGMTLEVLREGGESL